MTRRFQYHLGFILPPLRSEHLRQHLPAELPLDAIRPTHFLSLCLVAETALPHPFLRQRCIAAFDRPLPPAIDFHFRSIQCTNGLCQLRASGKMKEASDSIAVLASYLAAQGINLPQHPPKAQPSIILANAAKLPSAQPRSIQPYLWQWTPQRLALIEEDQLSGHHKLLQQWELDQPLQPCFGFDDWIDAA